MELEKREVRFRELEKKAKERQKSNSDFSTNHFSPESTNIN